MERCSVKTEEAKCLIRGVKKKKINEILWRRYVIYRAALLNEKVTC
jgi:hypothetical protein